MEVLVEYEYIGVEEDELTIRRGDIISNVERLSDGWMEGELDGKRGAFPDNFVKEIKKDESKVKTKEPPPKKGGNVADLANKLGTQGIKMGPPPNGNAKVTKRDQSRRKLRAKVAFSYSPANDDELRLEVGDTLDIIKQEEEGWWEGTLNGKTGMFPSNFVEMVPDDTHQPETEDKPDGANDKDKKKVIGVGLGNIFKDGPINLRPTGELSKPTPEREPKPAVKAEEKTGSLKKNAPSVVKQPPALPPKDITETKKVSPSKDKNERYPVQHWSQSTSPSPGVPALECIPEMDMDVCFSGPAGAFHMTKGLNRPTDSCGYQVFSSSPYDRNDGHGCPHGGDDFDYSSFASEGSQCSQLSDEFNSPPGSPMYSYKRKNMKSLTLNLGKTVDSRILSGSDVPLDLSELSHTRPTPPPKMSFRQHRRSKTTPKRPSSMSVTIPSNMRDIENHPRKRPRKVLSTIGVSWTNHAEVITKKTGSRCPVNMNQSAPEVEMNTDGLDSWVSVREDDYRPGLQKHFPVLKKKLVSFTSKDKVIGEQFETVTSQDEFEVEMPHSVIAKMNVFKVIDGKKITDSVLLNKEKMKSGKWKKSNDLVSKEIQTTRGLALSLPIQRTRSLLRRSIDRISGSITASSTKVKITDNRAGQFEPAKPEDKLVTGHRIDKLVTAHTIDEQVRTHIKDKPVTALSIDKPITAHRVDEPVTANNIDETVTAHSMDKPVTAHSIDKPVTAHSIDEMVTAHSIDKPVTAHSIDVVSATPKPLNSPTKNRDSFRDLANNGPDDKGKRSSLKRIFSLRSPFSRFGKQRIKAKVSQIKAKSGASLKQEIIDGNTYIRLPEVEPSYLEALREMGKMSPSVRRLSQRYALFQKGNMRHSLQLLNESFIESVAVSNKYAVSLPTLPDKEGLITDQKKLHSTSNIEEIKAEQSLGEQAQQEETTQHPQETTQIPQETTTTDVPVAKKEKSHKRSSLLSSFGTWPRWVPTPEVEEVPIPEAQDQTEVKGAKVAKKKRFSLLRSKPAGDSKPVEHGSAKPKKRRSLFGSLRRRFFNKKSSRSAECVDNELIVIGHKMEILAVERCQPAVSESTAEEMSKRVMHRSSPLLAVTSQTEDANREITSQKPVKVDDNPQKPTTINEDQLKYKVTSDKRSLQSEEEEKVNQLPINLEYGTNDTLFGRSLYYDDAISHEEVIDNDGYVVVDELNSFAEEKEAEVMAAERVGECIWTVMSKDGKVQSSSKQEFLGCVWAYSNNDPTSDRSPPDEASRRNHPDRQPYYRAMTNGYRTLTEEEIQQSNDKQPYYRAMTDGYRTLTEEDIQQSNDSLVVNVSSNNSNTISELDINNNNNSDLGLLNLSSRLNDSTNGSDIIDAYIGLKPSPIKPEQGVEIRTKIDKIFKFYEGQMQSGRMYLDVDVGNDSPEYQTSWTTGHPSLTNSSCNETKPAGSMFYGEVETQKIRHRMSRELKPAGSLFYGTAEPQQSILEVQKEVVPSPVKCDPKSRFAGSYFIVRSPAEVSAAVKKTKSASVIGTSTPKVKAKWARSIDKWWINVTESSDPSSFRPTWSPPSLTERPIGIHFGTPTRSMKRENASHQLKCPVAPEERPVGIHNGIVYQIQTTPEDQPVGVHNGLISHSGDENKEEEKYPTTIEESYKVPPDSLKVNDDLCGYALSRKAGHARLMTLPVLSQQDISPDSSINFSSSIVERLPL